MIEANDQDKLLKEVKVSGSNRKDFSRVLDGERLDHALKEQNSRVEDLFMSQFKKHEKLLHVAGAINSLRQEAKSSGIGVRLMRRLSATGRYEHQITKLKRTETQPE